MRYYFCYEMSITGQWSPVLYHGERPQRQHRPATALVAYDSPEEPSFATLMRIFPRIVEEETVEMVRPVEGFQTKDGKFFDDERSATVHETTYELSSAFYKQATLWPGVNSLADNIKDDIVEAALQFLRDNRETVVRYLEASERQEEVEETTEATTPVAEVS